MISLRERPIDIYIPEVSDYFDLSCDEIYKKLDSILIKPRQRMIVPLLYGVEKFIMDRVFHRLECLLVVRDMRIKNLFYNLYERALMCLTYEWYINNKVYLKGLDHVFFYDFSYDTLDDKIKNVNKYGFTLLKDIT